MREKDITGRQKDLSRQAQELGFPQEVDRGDWYLIGEQPILCNYSEGTLRAFDPEKHALVLEYRHCLAWFEKEDWEIRSIVKGVHPREGQFCITIRDAAAKKYEDGNSRFAFGSTVDEAAAALVNKLTELKK